MKILQVVAELSHVDGMIHMTKLMSAFYNFANKLKDGRAESDISYPQRVPEIRSPETEQAGIE